MLNSIQFFLPKWSMSASSLHPGASFLPLNQLVKNYHHIIFIWTLFNLSRFKYFWLRSQSITYQVTFWTICPSPILSIIGPPSSWTIYYRCVCPLPVCHQSPVFARWYPFFLLPVSSSARSSLHDPETKMIWAICVFKWRLHEAPTRPSFKVWVPVSPFQQHSPKRLHL